MEYMIQTFQNFNPSMFVFELGLDEESARSSDESTYTNNSKKIRNARVGNLE